MLQKESLLHTIYEDIIKAQHYYARALFLKGQLIQIKNFPKN